MERNQPTHHWVSPRASKAKICQVLPGPAASDSETLAIWLAQAHREQYEFLFVCLGDPSPALECLRDDGFPVYVVRPRSGLDWRCARLLERVFRREAVDLVHAHQTLCLFYSLMARLYYSRPSILLTVHECRSSGPLSPRRLAANRILLEGRDQIVAAGRCIRQGLILDEGLPAEQVRVIYPRVDLRPFASSGQDGHLVRREIGVPEDAFLVLQIARFEPLQDHALALQALEQLIRIAPRTRLALVGEGSEITMVRELVQSWDLKPYVHFLGCRDDQARLLTASDVVLLTSIREDIPRALIMAMAAGRPVVATRVGGVGEVVEDRASGLLVSPGDYSSLVEHLRLLGENPGLRKQLGHHGQRRAEAMFSEAVTYLRYSELYREMLSR